MILFQEPSTVQQGREILLWLIPSKLVDSVANKQKKLKKLDFIVDFESVSDAKLQTTKALTFLNWKNTVKKFI